MPEDFLLAGGNAGRTSSVREEHGPKTTFDQRWQNAASCDFGLHGPIVVDETVYVLTVESDEEDNLTYTLVGYDLDDGRGTCRISVPAQTQCYEIASDGRLIYAMTDKALQAINPQSEQIEWSTDFPDNPEYFEGRIVVTADSVYATFTRDVLHEMMQEMFEDDGNGGWDLKVGEVTASSEIGSSYQVGQAEMESVVSTGVSATLAYSDEMVFSVITTELVAADCTTGDVWTESIRDEDETADFRVDPAGIVADQSTVYVAPASSYEQEEEHGVATRGDKLQKNVTAYDSQTGTVQWQTAMSESGVDALAVAENVLIAYESAGGGQNTGRVVALDATDGSRLWEHYDIGSEPTISGVAVYAGTTDGSLVGLSVETGDEIQRYEMDAAPVGAPRILRDRFVVPTTAGLTCLEVTDRLPPSTSGQDTETDGTADAQCPNCGETVGSDLPFCAGCGTKLGSGPSCPGCGEGLHGDEAFCPSCGRELDTTEACPSCGNELDGDEMFCPSCGTNVSSED